MVPQSHSLAARSLTLAAFLLIDLSLRARWQIEPSLTPTASVSASPTMTPLPPSPTPSPDSTSTPIIDTATSAPSDTPTAVATTGTSTASPTHTASTETMTPSVTPSPSRSGTTSPSPTSTASPSPTSTTPATEPPPIGIVIINEIAWAGTTASPYDEWIELHNTSGSAISLDGWVLTDGGDITTSLSGTITPYNFFLLERTDDTTVASIPADQIYTGALSNSGETLRLVSPDGTTIDSANIDGGSWPAGNASARASMERLGGQDIAGNWRTFNGLRYALNSEGNLIAGTPRGENSTFAATPTPTPSPPLTATSSPTANSPGSVLINEVAWAGTVASASDEWIELYNPGPTAVSVDGWQLTDDGDIRISLTGVLDSYGYLLLERTDDNTIRDISADFIYSGSLRNSGESLKLLDLSGRLIDSANLDGGGWPGGDSDPRRSMERWGGADRAGNWGTFTGYGGLGHDADGNPIGGTPRSGNSVLTPTPTPTWIPGSLVINEVLIRPHYDWEGTGGVSTADEFIEIYNRGPGSVWLRGWLLDDVSGGGSKPFALPGVTISANSHAVFFRSMTHIALNDSGDSVRLMAPNGTLIDKIHYLRVRAYNLSYGRLPDGSNELAYGLWPTPGEANLLFVEPAEVAAPRWEPRPSFACPEGGQVRTLLPRLNRQPWRPRWFVSLNLAFCDQTEFD